MSAILTDDWPSIERAFLSRLLQKSRSSLEDRKKNWSTLILMWFDYSTEHRKGIGGTKVDDKTLLSAIYLRKVHVSGGDVQRIFCATSTFFSQINKLFFTMLSFIILSINEVYKLGRTNER